MSPAVHVGDGCDSGPAVSLFREKFFSWAIVGAGAGVGAVVINDFACDVKVVGAPAKVIKIRQSGWHLGSE